MNIVIDFSQVPTNSVWAFVWFILSHGGWIVVLLIFVYYGAEEYVAYKRVKYRSRWDWSLLSISLPRLNEKTPQAVEYIFTALSGSWKHIDWIERFFLGKQQPEFSFELVSREGYIEYLVRAPRQYRDLVEAAIYAQYPDAEIAEIPDYAEKYKGLSWPDNDGGYEIWGTSFKQSKKYYYPIRTWKELGEVDSDPVNSILENVAKIKTGEEFWFQIIVTPVANNWQKNGISLVKRLNGLKGSKSVVDEFLDLILEIPNSLLSIFISRPETPAAKPSAKPAVAPGFALTTKEKAVVESIQEKIGKIGFRTTMRAVYIARKEVFNKSRIKEGFLGALHQYTSLYSNGFIQSKYTKVSTSHLYYFRKYRVNHFRKNKLLTKYRVRSTRAGSQFGTGFILNISELASLWHFPVGSIKTLMIKKSEAVKAEAPFYLPVEEAGRSVATIGTAANLEGPAANEPDEVSIEEENGPPDNLPIG